MFLLSIALPIAAGLGYVLFVYALYRYQGQFLYRPVVTIPDRERAGLADAVVVPLQTSDGLTLTAWYLPPPTPDSFTVLYFHGNGSHIGHRGARARQIQSLGWGVLLLGYRGFGGNPGYPSEEGLMNDARAGIAALRGFGVPANRLLLWGESLGTGVAVGMAAETDIAALLLEHPYSSITEASQGQYPYVPVRWLLKDHYNSFAHIPQVRAPILVMQGADDRLVPPWMGRKLIAAAKVPTQLWTVEGAGHEDLTAYGGLEIVARFVETYAGPHPLTR